MRSLLTLLLLLQSTGVISHLRYQRAVAVPSPGQACVALDPAVYIHAAPSLADLRLFAGAPQLELPFALLVNGSATGESDAAPVRNLHQVGRTLSFDLDTPSRLYTDVVLQLVTPHLLARATVTAAGVSLGEFTLFDLGAEGLPMDTTLHLQETAARTLHVSLAPLPGAPALSPEALKGATVPPGREAQTLFTTALSTDAIEQVGSQTVARFRVPAHLPIDRVRVTLAPGKAPNFLRPLRITSHVAADPGSPGEELSGTLGHLRLDRSEASLRFDHLTVPAALGANLQNAAQVEVRIENGTAAPLPIASIFLETRERQLCFDAPPSGPVFLFYGDAKLDSPSGDFAHQFRLATTIHAATLGPEQPNPQYTPREGRTFLLRHPRLFSLGSIFVICLMGVAVLRSKKLRI